MNTSQKILICGFPHCGTSILKSIIGHIEDVEEIYNETTVITKNSAKKFILGKFPFALDSFFDEKYKDYIKIFIIRNPLFVFSSLNKRFNYKIPNDHNFACYINTLKKDKKEQQIKKRLCRARHGSAARGSAAGGARQKLLLFFYIIVFFI